MLTLFFMEDSIVFIENVRDGMLRYAALGHTAVIAAEYQLWCA